MANTDQRVRPYLLSLPAELRAHIYRYAVVEDKTIRTYIEETSFTEEDIRFRAFPLRPIIAAVSKTLRKEVLALYYGENEFDLDRQGYSMDQSKLRRQDYPQTECRNWTVAEWCRFLGDHANDLRNVSISEVTRIHHSKSGRRTVDEHSMKVKAILRDGTILFERKEGELSACACDLYLVARQRFLGQRMDGRCMLDVLGGGFDQRDLGDGEVWCADCGLPKLDDSGTK